MDQQYNIFTYTIPYHTSIELLAYLRYMFTSTLKYMYIQPCKSIKMHVFLGIYVCKHTQIYVYIQPCMVTKFAYTTISNHMYLSTSILSSVLQIIVHFLHATDTHPSALQDDRRYQDEYVLVRLQPPKSFVSENKIIMNLSFHKKRFSHQQSKK